jgi:hypothetical protein
MDKQKRADQVVPEMRDRLTTNRYGKLTNSQWLDMVTQPLMSLLVMLVPVAIVLPRILAVGRILFVAAPLVLVGLAVLALARAYRYARAPIYFEEMRAPADSPPFWVFWRAVKLENEQGQTMRFGKRLAPTVTLQQDRTYLVYFLREPGDNVLLSLAPADHPDADAWRPTTVFARRLKQRGGDDQAQT